MELHRHSKNRPSMTPSHSKSRSTRWTCLAFGLLLAFAPTLQAGDAPRRHRWYHPRGYLELGRRQLDRWRKAEIVEMLSALVGGQMPDAGKGWFHEGQSRYGWRWLADRYDADADGAIVADEFPAAVRELLATLDRDGDGQIKPNDFDWSADAPFVKKMSQARRFFGPLDQDHNGQITRDEWEAFFDRAAVAEDSLTAADLQAALFPPDPEKSKDSPSNSGPTPLGLLQGFASGELGSVEEGPAIGQQAPDFLLADHAGERRIRLSQYHGQKPVVLIFGSFT
jgi:Ca2+-binding EF-hand superfamily protein